MLVTNSEIFRFMNTSWIVKDTTLIQTYSISLLGLRDRPGGSGQDNETAKLLIASSVFVINSSPLIGQLRPLLGSSDWLLLLPSEIPSEHLILSAQTSMKYHEH